MTVYGATGGGINVNASYSRNENSDRSETHTNSTLNADNIQITSVGDTNAQGTTVRAEDELEMHVGGDLNVASVQDHHSSSSHGNSISGGVSLTGGQAAKGSHVMSDTSSAGTLTGVNGGFNVSNGRERSRDTVLTSLTSGGTAHITVGGNTDIKGATIATTDEDGKDTGQLTLQTGTLTYSDLSNTSYSSSMSAGLNTGVGIGQAVNEDTGETETTVSAGYNTSSAQLSNTSNYHKGKTLATIGQGNLIIGDEAGSDDTTALNRDVENSDTDLFTVERQQGNFNVSIDHRLYSEEGWNSIAEDAYRTMLAGSSVADVFTQESVAASDTAEHMDVVQKELDVELLVAKEHGDSTVSINNLDTATAAQKQKAINDYAAAYAQVFGISIDSALVIAVNKAMGGAHYSSGSGGSNIVINDAALKNAKEYMTTLAHEVTHGLESQGVIGSKGDQSENYAELIGSYGAENYAFALEHAGLGSLNTGNVNQHIGNNSALIQNNWNTVKDVPVSQLDFEMVQDGGYKRFAQLVSTEPALSDVTLGQMNQILDDAVYLMTYGAMANAPSSSDNKMAYVVDRLKEQGVSQNVLTFLYNNRYQLADYVIEADEGQKEAYNRALTNVMSMGIADLVRDPSGSERVNAIQETWDNAFTAAGVPSGAMGLAELGTDIAKLLVQKGVPSLSKTELIAAVKSWGIDITQASKQEMDNLYQNYVQGSSAAQIVKSEPLPNYTGGNGSFIAEGVTALDSPAYTSTSMVDSLSDNQLGLSIDVGDAGRLVDNFADDADFSDVGAGTVLAEKWSGSGLEAGVLGANSLSSSTQAIQNYYPKEGSIEFIFDTKSETFLVGKPKSGIAGLSPHQQLAHTIDANSSDVVGGMFRRGANGEIITNEFSGHFWENWNQEKRQQFQQTLKAHGIVVQHNEGM
ncbi:hypothetical protein VA7868_03823 [Vibrio aerogenes CECT 7868]|uniref:Bacterial toxin 43 domain-containing protein n=2 Tax=Vibrio aerogenes TaxID=92172 RepID=A0A1M6BKN9_9VIBR|nr:hypothetical protein VA7868_03823 [Vibrio aerogenes CECT 7868]